MGFVDLMATTFKVFIRAAPAAVAGTVVLAVPGFIISVLVSAQLYRIFPTINNVNEARFFGNLIVLALFLLAVSVESMILAFCTAVARDVHISGRASFGSAMSAAWRNLLSIVWVYFLVGVLFGAIDIAAGAIGAHGTTSTTITLVVVLAFEVWLGVKLALFIPVILVERRRGTAAMARSMELVKGSWWRCFGYLTLIAVTCLAVSIATAMATGGVADPLAALHVPGAALPGAASLAEHSSVSLVALIVQLVAPFMLVALWTVLVYVLFADLQVRKGLPGTAGPSGPRGAPSPGQGPRPGPGFPGTGGAGVLPPFGTPGAPAPQGLAGPALPAFGSGPSAWANGPPLQAPPVAPAASPPPAVSPPAVSPPAVSPPAP